jgi:succinate dehydrogenase/fumarate reductase flavoprotein subunit
MKKMCDVLVIGGGAAAVRVAIEAATAGVNTLLVDKGDFERSGTSPLAIHGFSTVLGADDSETTLYNDIVRNGGGLSDLDLVEVAVAESRFEPDRLESMGVRFIHHKDGSFYFYRGAGHTVPHGVTFNETFNGANFVAVLGKEAWKRGVKLLDNVMMTELLIENNRVYGAVGIDKNGEEVTIAAGAVVLAAGGANRIFPNVVPRIADERYRTTGDGLVLGLKAGLSLVDMEMANFRDTPPAARIGRYMNRKDEAFMSKYDPMLEKAPRGKVVEALYREMQAGNGPLYIEVTPEGERTAPILHKEYRDYVEAYKNGQRPPVTITFQRLLGGVRIDTDAATAISGLFAAGENTGGFHGGDRLQGAAFLETQVFGSRAGRNAAAVGRGSANENKSDALAKPAFARIRPLMGGKNGRAAEAVIKDIQKLTWDNTSIIKNAAGLQAALPQIRQILAEIVKGIRGQYLFQPLEAYNLAVTAEAIVLASLQRTETRATHRRSDFPKDDPALGRKHTCVQMDSGELKVIWVACRDAKAEVVQWTKADTKSR